MKKTTPVFKNFAEFYPLYLVEHSTQECRRFHFFGTSGVISTLILFFFTGHLGLLFLLPILGYGFAWAGHFFYEKNTPTTFKYPYYSLLADFKLFWAILMGRIRVF